MISLATENNKKKKKSKLHLKPGVIAALKVSFILFLAVALVFLAARSIGGFTLTSITADIKIALSNLGSGDGFPFDTAESSVQKIYSDGSKIFTFHKNKTLLLSTSAKELSEIAIDYGSPAVKYKDGKAIIYDRDSGNFRIQKTSETINEKKVNNTIAAAAIGKKGNFAVAAYDSAAQTLLTVFNQAEEEAFTWQFSNEKVTDIDLSDDGKYAVVGTIAAKNAQTDSKIYVFKFDAKEYIACFDYPDNIVVSVRYNSAHDIEIITDKMRSFITDNTTKMAEDAFGSDVLYRKSDENSSISAIALLKYGSDSHAVVRAYKGESLLFNVDVGVQVKSVSCSDKYLAILTDTQVLIYNKKGEKIAELEASASANNILINGKKVYIISSVKIECKKF